jgi:hypothetical protein
VLAVTFPKLAAL